MNTHPHLSLPLYQSELPRQPRTSRFGGYELPEGRNKGEFSRVTTQKAEAIAESLKTLKRKFSDSIDPSLIYEIEINQGASPSVFEETLSAMGIHVLSVAENKRGYWVVFCDDSDLHRFRSKLATYGSEEGPKYDFFNAIESVRDIPREEKTGKGLTDRPLGKDPEFIDIELWKIPSSRKNDEFITQLKQKYVGNPNFRITDILTTKSFVLLRVKLNGLIFNEIIDLKEIARSDRPNIPSFNTYGYKNIDINQMDVRPPADGASGILVIDSGILSNHPMLRNCVGGEENFQTGESATHDTVGHGTAVAGCAAFGDIEQCIVEKSFTASNWIFSAKVMYAVPIGNEIRTEYDPEKLVEHQLKDAVEYFLSNSEYHIRVVNMSIGNSNEIWHKHYNRQLPLASLIDELALTYPYVTFIVSAGNQRPQDVFDSIEDIVAAYPKFLQENGDFKIINPATAALALTVGSVASPVRHQLSTYGTEQIKIPIADYGHPSPFSRTGPGINGMIKPELVEYGGNLILFNNYGHITEDAGGKLAVLNNQSTENIIRFVSGTSFAAPKVARTAGMIANRFPQRSANFVNNMLLVGADYEFIPNSKFYDSDNNDKALEAHLTVSGYGVPDFQRAINSFDNRVVLFDEGKIGLDQMKVYSLQLPDIFFSEEGRKKITVVLTFNPETRSTRGDSYLGNTMEFHLFHSVNPQVLVEKYGIVSEETEKQGIPPELKKSEISMIPGTNTRKKGCHQKAWKEYKKEPKSRPQAPLSLVLLNYKKWVDNPRYQQEYCISVMFQHEKSNKLYNAIRASIQARVRVR